MYGACDTLYRSLRHLVLSFESLPLFKLTLVSLRKASARTRESGKIGANTVTSAVSNNSVYLNHLSICQSVSRPLL